MLAFSVEKVSVEMWVMVRKAVGVDNERVAESISRWFIIVRIVETTIISVSMLYQNYRLKRMVITIECIIIHDNHQIYIKSFFLKSFSER